MPLSAALGWQPALHLLLPCRAQEQWLLWLH